VSTYNILSIDGGGPFVLMPLLLLQRIERERPGFLRSVDLFAGTSAGGISAVMLAAHDNPVDGLERTIQFWRTTPILSPHALHLGIGLTGLSSLYSHDLLQAALRNVLGGRTLRELTNRVLVASIQLDDRSPNARTRSWKPRALSNLPVEGETYLDDTAVDIALRSSAGPIVWPVFQGYVDGGLFANDPSMLALSRVLQEGREAGRHARERLGDISLFSLGEGQAPHFLPVGTASWGYRKWLLNRQVPFALVELALSSTGDEIGEQCRLLLSDRQYYRLNPDIDAAPSRLAHTLSASTLWERIVRRMRGAAAELTDPMLEWRRQAEEIGSSYPLTEALAWIDASDWPKREVVAAR
jgi:hypothetical protein